MPDADEKTPTPITVVGGPRRRRQTRANLAVGRSLSWPDAAVSITRILVGNAVVGYLALRGVVEPEVALIALGVGAVPGVARLIAGAVQRRPGR